MAILAIFVLTNSASGQCCLTLPTNNILTAYITTYPNWIVTNGDPNPVHGFTTPPAGFTVDVLDPTSPIPIGIYPAWCVDESTILNPTYFIVPGLTVYSGTLISTCDPIGLANLPFRLGTPPVGPPPIVDVATWHQINYILNHKSPPDYHYYWWNVQAAINRLVGGPAPNDPLNDQPNSYPPVDINEVAVILNDATSNAAAWLVPCGGSVGAIFDIASGAGQNSPFQLILLEVPCCQVSFSNCPPDLSLGCNPDPSSIPDCHNPVDTNVVFATSCCGYPVTITCTKSDFSGGCLNYRILTYTASDGYGHTATCTRSISWIADTNAPDILNAPTNMNLGCNPANLPTDASIAAQVTTKDMCSSSNATVSVSHKDATTNCTVTRTFIILATDNCGNAATQPVVYSWTIDTNAPVIVVGATNCDLGCNPVLLPSIASLKAQVTVLDTCSATSTNVSFLDATTNCTVTRAFTITAMDACGNTATPKTVVYTWTVDTNAPVLTRVPTNNYLGCNPVNVPTDASVALLVTAADGCGAPTIKVTHVDGGTACAMARTFTITASDGCGNTSAPSTVVYTWSVDLTAPTITSVPVNSNLGCNPATLPSDASVKAQVIATDNCTMLATNVSHLDVTNVCTVTRTFTITVCDACGNVSLPKTVAYTWTADTTAPVVTCPPDVTISNSYVLYCTYTPADYGAVCNGTNASSILTNCFKKIYTNGYMQCGITNATGYCIKFTTCTNIQKFIPYTGTPGCLKTNYSNPTSCEAGVFAGQALCLKLNVDFGDAKSVTGFAAGCGDLILKDPACSLDGRSIRQILDICHTALGGGNISAYGCTISNLSIVCSNLNQSFQNCKPSDWCKGHLVPPAITNISPSVTGYATVIDKCSSTPTLTYKDVITPGTCSGTYVIARTWLAVDGCGNSNSCTQNIFVGNSKASVCGYVFMDCNGDGFLTPGLDSGLPNVAVTLKNASNVAIATNTTDAQGSYCFFNLTPGTYSVSTIQPTGHVQTAGTCTNHWLNSTGQQCWIDRDLYQHWKGGDGVDCWTASDGYQHWKNSANKDCWKDKNGTSHTQNCTYVSCDVPTNNTETFTLALCQALTCVNFSYQGVVPKPVVCVTGPSTGHLWQTAVYTCNVTNTGTACFSACQVTACGKSFTCPPLRAGEGCSFPISYQFQLSDFGSFNCQATASCNYSSSSNPSTAQGTCNTWVTW